MMRVFFATSMKPIVASLLVVMFAGCASPVSQTPEGAVKARATARWQLLLKGDLDKAYQYESPSFRSITSLESFKGRLSGKVQWVGAEVVDTKCEVQKCNAKVRIDAKVFLAGRNGSTISTHVDEPWVLEDNQWWHFENL